MKKILHLLRITKNALRMVANNSISALKFIIRQPYTSIPLYLLFFLLPTLLLAQPAFVKDSLDAYVNREIKKWNIPGVSVAIVKDGKIVVCKGYGVKDITKKDAVDENTLFQIASNTKAFTGTSIALLAYQKRLSLDDKVSRWMPDFKLYDPLASN
ncbi:MAG TPA: serine hydrolase domain-containing protein, partial [Bacteroidia bacterium]